MGPRTLHLPNCQRVLFLKCKSNQVFPAYNPSISREPNWNFLAWHIISFIICLLASSSVIPQELLYVLITQLAIFKILSALKCSTLSWDSLTINCLHKWFLHVWQDPLRLSPPPPWCLLSPHLSQAEGKQGASVARENWGREGERMSWGQRVWGTVPRAP